MPERNQAVAVIALAGRRIDLTHTKAKQFPLENLKEVRRRVAEALKKNRAVALVSSAACGADLVALKEAERLGLRRRIVLPCAVARFRENSVVDRPGEWGPEFDHQIAAAAAACDLVVLDFAACGEAAYAAANAAIVREAEALARAAPQDRPHRLIALLVWEARPRSEMDATNGFRDLTRDAGFEVQSISTL